MSSGRAFAPLRGAVGLCTRRGAVAVALAARRAFIPGAVIRFSGSISVFQSVPALFLAAIDLLDRVMSVAALPVSIVGELCIQFTGNRRQNRLVRAGGSGTSNADVRDTGLSGSAPAASSMAPSGESVLATTGGISEMAAMPSLPSTMTTSSAGGTTAASTWQQFMPIGSSSSVTIDLTELD